MAQELPAFLADMDRLARTIGEDLTEPLEACKQPIGAGIATCFDSQSSPEGSAWAPLAFGNHSILNVSGALRSAATGSGGAHIERIENRSELVWGVSKEGSGGLPGAAVHQFGATIFPTEKKFLHFFLGDKEVFASEVTIPARPYLGITDDAAITIDGIFGDWLQEQAAGGAT